MGRLCIIAAGAGCLALLMFVAPELVNRPAPALSSDEIVAEVLGPEEPEAREKGGLVDAVIPVPSPLVGIRNDGEEVAIVFPATELPAPEADEAATPEGGMEVDALPPVLSACDVAEAREALEGSGASEPEGPVAREGSMGREEAAEPERVAGDEEAAAEPFETVESETSGDAEDRDSLAVVESKPEPPAAGQVAEAALAVASELLAELAALHVEAPEDEAEAVRPEKEVAAVLPVEGASSVDDGEEAIAARLAARRGEFDIPVPLDSRSSGDISHPSGGVPAFAAAEAAQAGSPVSGLPPRSGMIVPGTLRGVMGYRLPLVSRQEVPDQIVSGVLIPAHTTFVIVREGYWELVDLTAEEVRELREDAAREEREAAMSAAKPKPVKEPWSLWRMLRGRRVPADE